MLPDFIKFLNVKIFAENMQLNISRDSFELQKNKFE